MELMIRKLISILIILIVLGAAWWVFSMVAEAIGLPPIFMYIIIVVLVVVIAIWALKTLRSEV